ncbi:MAG: GspH/FimT family pseudopilin [Acidobacteriota bacterium]
MQLITTAPMRRTGGFTIIELAIAMVIFGFLIMAAAPSLQDWFSNTRIRGTAESIQNGLQTARAEAIRRNRSVSFWLVDNDNPDKFLASCTVSDTGTAWMVSVNSPAGNCDDTPSQTDSPMIVTGRTAGDSGAHVVVTGTQSDGSTAASSVTFNGFGGVTGSGSLGQIDIKSDTNDSASRSLRIVISASGMVRMCDPKVTSSGDPRKC